MLAAFAALSGVGYGGMRASSSEYGYGYGYEYEYDNATLIVVKHVINNDNGKATASQFTMTISGVVAVGGNTFAGAESPGVTKTVDPGSYSVTESGPSGYVSSFSADCAGSIAAGDTKTCTVTNNDIAPVETPGYWKNHPEVITANALLPQPLGAFTVNSLADVNAVFDAMNCSSTKSGDAAGCLAGQLLAAELNLAMGSLPCVDIVSTIAAANALLTAIGYSGPSGTYTLTDAQRAQALTLKDALDRYNNKGCK